MSKGQFLTVMLIMVFCLTTLLGGCGAQSASTAEDSTILVGISAPLTGNCAKAGQDMVDGAQLAVDEINEAGGVLGRQLELVAQDDGGEPQMAVQAANKLLSKNVDVITGYYNSGACNATLPIYNKSGMPVILNAVCATILTHQGFDNVFRIQSYSDQQAVVAIASLVDDYKAKKIAVVVDNTAGPRDVAKVVVEHAQERNIEIYQDEITASEKDFAAVVAKLEAYNPDAIYIAGFYAEGALLAKQIRGAGITVPVMVSEGCVDPQFMAIAGDSSEGILMTSPPMPETLPGAKEFIAKFTEKYNVAPATFSVYAYDAIYLYADAVKRANSTDKEAVTQALRDSNYEGYTGNIAFDENGDLTHPGYVLLVVKDGKLAPAE